MLNRQAALPPAIPGRRCAMKKSRKALRCVLLLVLTAAAVLYIEGYYDFTFIDRRQMMNVLPALSGETETVSPYGAIFSASPAAS